MVSAELKSCCLIPRHGAQWVVAGGNKADAVHGIACRKTNPSLRTKLLRARSESIPGNTASAPEPEVSRTLTLVLKICPRFGASLAAVWSTVKSAPLSAGLFYCSSTQNGVHSFVEDVFKEGMVLVPH